MKPKLNVKIDVFDNGASVTVKRKGEIIGAKVFEGEDHAIRYSNWIKELGEKEKQKELEE